MRFQVLSRVQERLYNLLERGQWRSNEELAELTGLSPESVHEVMDTLRRDGFVWLHRGPFNEQGVDVWKWKKRSIARQ